MAFTMDHINPRAKGGGKTVPSCFRCNQLKGSLHPAEWFWFIDNHPGYWREFRNHGYVARRISQERIRRRLAGEEPMVRRYLAPLNDEETLGDD